jgi:ornithine cyclodeaminase/alanine dehydrogenase-like protein (mu-crystallin family)
MSTILILSRRDLEPLVPFADYVEAVAEAFRLHTSGRAVAPAPLYIAGEDGGFHVKGASLPLGNGYVAFKTNANFPQNKRRAGPPPRVTRRIGVR